MILLPKLIDKTKDTIRLLSYPRTLLILDRRVWSENFITSFHDYFQRWYFDILTTHSAGV